MPYVHSNSGELQISSQTRPSVLTAAHSVRAFLNKTKLQGRSSFALFVDISHAFYRVVRQLAYGADHSDEDTVQLLRRLGFSEFCLQDLAVQMQQSAALDSLGCPDFLQKQVKELHTMQHVVQPVSRQRTRAHAEGHETWRRIRRRHMVSGVCATGGTS